MPGLSGSAPKVSTTTQPTVDPAQQALISSLASTLGGAGTLGSTFNFGNVQAGLSGNQYAAPLSPLQTSSVQGMENLVNAYTQGPVSAQPGTASALGTGLNTLTNAATANPVSLIDSTQAFNQGVVQPLTSDFTQYTIPAIAGSYGQSAGGAFSSDALGARQQAGTNLARTLAQAGSQYSLAAAQQNQQAQATNAALRTAAAQAIPAAVGAPLALDTGQQNLLTQTLAGGAVPQQTQQAQLSGEYTDFQSMLQQVQQQLADALGLSTAPTQTTQTVVNPGQTGLLAALIGSLGAGVGAYGSRLALGGV